jgi:hypothetical protein
VDQATLVKNDKIIGPKVVEALRAAGIDISAWKWIYEPELEEWQLLIGTSLVDAKGLRTTYGKVTDALEKAKIYKKVPMRRVVLKSPSDPQVKAIERDLREQKESSIHILKHRVQGKVGFSIVFGPVIRSGSMRSFWDREELEQFLSKDIALESGKIASALHELSRTDATSISPVTLTPRQTKSLGL